MKQQQSMLATLALVAGVRAAAAQDSPRSQPEAPAAPSPESPPSTSLWLRVSQMYLSEAGKLGSAELTGVGLSLRLHFLPWLAAAGWIDVYTGHDKYDARRTEVNLGLDWLFYLNPQDAVQVFGLVGVGSAAVIHSERWADERTVHRQLQIGLGLEFRATPRLSFDVSTVAFTRSVNDAGGPTHDDDDPREHVPFDSNGVVLRGGTGFYF